MDVLVVGLRGSAIRHARVIIEASLSQSAAARSDLLPTYREESLPWDFSERPQKPQSFTTMEPDTGVVVALFESGSQITSGLVG